MKTKEEIEQMPAGKQLDALVAEKVMGCVWVHNKRYGSLRTPEDADDLVEGSNASYGRHPDHETGAWVGPYDKYSVDIAAAWQVVTHLQARGYTVKVVTLGKLFTSAEIMEPPKHDKDWPPAHGARAETAALAICRAALLATIAHA